jgi:hypothetical protein
MAVLDHLIPTEEKIFSWISEVFAHGIRRPGYPADRWAESWLQEQFRGLGLEDVRAEPVELPSWEPLRASLVVTGRNERLEVDCFQLPHTATSADVEGELVAFDASAPGRVGGAVALCDVPLMRVPHPMMVALATWPYDPASTLADSQHILPFGRAIQDVMAPSTEAGAVAFVGALTDYPGDSRDYYVPYDAVARPQPGVWVSGSDGQRLRALLAAGSVRARLAVEARSATITSYNVVGELPGPDDETVITGSHHDGPWASAVEDGSGIALVLAQAAYWARVPRADRPHRLVFLLNAGHMAGGAGARSYCATHASELERTVLEVHLEHAAAEFEERDGRLCATGQPEARWWFTSRIARLESAVRAAIEAEDLRRSLLMPPEAFGPRPTTDGSEFYVYGVPFVNYLTAPFYLFDAMDTLDKIHRPSLVPVTRAAIRIIASTTGVSAAAMRDGAVPSTRSPDDGDRG